MKERTVLGTYEAAGTEPLNQTVSVKVTATMKEAVKGRSRDWLRDLIQRELDREADDAKES